MMTAEMLVTLPYLEWFDLTPFSTALSTRFHVLLIKVVTTSTHSLCILL